ncbi:MAG: hypothetical protein BGO05_16680 [Rhizobiales bacterium 63-7]|mgnify:CR=1 FL=1|nr:hypothetical protein [Hyphomicrobiales bacterium]OJU69049.1 MAG: hypothetical protein BGO05_16680 [Rhizobiales bacterium 63-7]
MSKVTITNNRPGGFGIPGGPVIDGGKSLTADAKDWNEVKDHPVVAAWIDAGHLTVEGGDTVDDASDDREELKKHATELGIDYAKNISTEKLKELIDAKLAL